MTKLTHLGIDYGSKLAGTTVAAWVENNQIVWRQTEKKKDADAFLIALLKELKPSSVFIDAPLSLPLAYTDHSKDDFFYRTCDRELRAMSPMFLGGLTARAMKLKYHFSDHKPLQFFETYPAGTVRQNNKLLPLYLKKNIEILPFQKALLECIPFAINTDFVNWHQVDAVLAWWTGYRYLQGDAITVGDAEEGLIII